MQICTWLSNSEDATSGDSYKTYKNWKIEKFDRLGVLLDSATRAQFHATRAQSRATERNSEKCSLLNLNLNTFGDLEYFLYLHTTNIQSSWEKSTLDIWFYDLLGPIYNLIDVLVCPASVPGRATLSWLEFPTWRQIALGPKVLRWTLMLW